MKWEKYHNHCKLRAINTQQCALFTSHLQLFCANSELSTCTVQIKYRENINGSLKIINGIFLVELIKTN